MRAAARVFFTNSMLRQLYDALRFAIADFFDVPWQAVIAMLTVTGLLSAYAFVRTNYSWNSHQLLQLSLLAGAFIVLAIAGKTLNRR